MNFDEVCYPDCRPPTPVDELRDVVSHLLRMLVDGHASGQVRVENVEDGDGTLHLDVDIFVKPS